MRSGGQVKSETHACTAPAHLATAMRSTRPTAVSPSHQLAARHMVIGAHVSRAGGNQFIPPAGQVGADAQMIGRWRAG